MSDKTREAPAIAQQLREQCDVLRMRPIPLNHMIPLMQEAADALDGAAANAQEVKRLREALTNIIEFCDAPFLGGESLACGMSRLLEPARAALQGDK